MAALAAGLTHADAFASGFRLGGTMRKAGDIGFLTAANITAADTVAGLDAAVVAVVGHADIEGGRHRVRRAITALDIAGVDDADILSLTTVEGVCDLTPATGKSNRDLWLQ